jgi:cyanuric acid amidohydrolase
MKQTHVHRLSMAHPGDVSELAALLDSGALRAADIVAVIGKTEGNGGVNDFTRGFFTQSLMLLLSQRLGLGVDEVLARVPCVLSGGTEGVLSPHYLVFSVSGLGVSPAAEASGRLAIGVAFSEPTAAEHVGRAEQIEAVADAVRRAMAQAQLTPQQVRFVQVKGPGVTVARALAATARGAAPLTNDPNRSMALTRAAGAFGVALALGETTLSAQALAGQVLRDFTVQSPRASVSSGVEVLCNEVIVLGNSPAWGGSLRIGHGVMQDALDIGGIHAALADLGLAASPQLSERDTARVRGVLVKCEPQRTGRIRGQRHTMLDDTDINAQRHIRGAVGGLVAGVLGDGRVFVSGGAEHQGPDGGGLIAVIAELGGKQ